MNDDDDDELQMPEPMTDDSNDNSHHHRLRSTASQRRQRPPLGMLLSFWIHSALASDWAENNDDDTERDGIVRSSQQRNRSSISRTGDGIEKDSVSTTMLHYHHYQCVSRVVLVLLVLLIMTFASLTTISVRYWNSSKSQASCSTTGGTLTQPEANSWRLFANSALRESLAHGAVASDHALCSALAATRILQQLSGNAVDAAVTTALCLGLVNPASSGLGGGAFLLVYHSGPQPKPRQSDGLPLPEFIDARNQPNDNDNERDNAILEVVDCRERAPGAAHTHMFDGLPSNASVVGGLAIAVLGELKCLELAHARLGSVPWHKVVAPVVELAQQGFAVGAYWAHQISVLAKASLAHSSNPDYGLRKLLTHGNDWNRPLQQGDWYQNEALAQTLDAIAKDGASALYRGTRAQSMAQEIQAAGGLVTVDDIQSYQATLRSPLMARHVQGFTVVGIPPPSSGGAAILGAVRFVSGFAAPLVRAADSLSAHRIVEACKHVFALRLSLSDPSFNTPTVMDVVQDLVATDYMDTLRREYYRDNATLPLSQYGGPKWALLSDGDGVVNVSDAKEGDRIKQRHRKSSSDSLHGRRRRGLNRLLQRPFGYLEDFGTSHFSVVDRNGHAVAMTTSVNTNFGSLVYSPSTGILFSNTMDDFSKPGVPNHYGLRPAESNYIMPGKRPLSSMSPTLVFRERSTDDTANNDLGDLVLAIGASGGPKIITSVLQVLLHYIYMGKPLLESVLHPRLHDQLLYHGSSVTAAEHAELTVPPTTPKNDGVGVANTSLVQSVLLDVSPRTRAALVTRGHRLLDIDFSGTVQAIAVDLETRKLTAVSDPRKGGSPAGY
jgi:gamma-glutamyltranspeptidase